MKVFELEVIGYIYVGLWWKVNSGWGGGGGINVVDSVCYILIKILVLLL